MCPFYVRIVFDRVVSSCSVKIYWLFQLGHMVNFSSIVGHIKFEAHFSVGERSKLLNFGKMGYTAL